MNLKTESEPFARTQIDLVALELLSASDKPVGNHSLVEVLQHNGVVVAEATAGRILRRLVSEGLARTVGKKGRVLTAAGRQRLDLLYEVTQRREQSERLIALADIGNVTSLLDMLHIRRAIEPEAARMAAERATDAEITDIDSLVCAHCQTATDGERRLDPAVSFHRQVILASHQPLLVEFGLLVVERTDSFLLDRISLDPAMTALTAEEVERDAHEYAADHERIAQALRTRAQDVAEQEMRAHLDKLIDRTRIYLARSASGGWKGSGV